MINKKVVILFILSIFLVSSIGIVHAAIPNPTEIVGDALNKVIKWFGYNISGNESMIIGLIRLLIFITLFVVFYQSQMWFYGARGITAQNNAIPIIISFSLSLISVLFIPKEVLVAISTTYGVIVSSALIGLPIVAALYFTIHILPSTNRFWYLIKFFIVMLVWFILAVFVDAIEKSGGQLLTIGMY